MATHKIRPFFLFWHNTLSNVIYTLHNNRLQRWIWHVKSSRGRGSWLFIFERSMRAAHSRDNWLFLFNRSKQASQGRDGGLFIFDLCGSVAVSGITWPTHICCSCCRRARRPGRDPPSGRRVCCPLARCDCSQTPRWRHCRICCDGGKNTLLILVTTVYFFTYINYNRKRTFLFFNKESITATLVYKFIETILNSLSLSYYHRVLLYFDMPFTSLITKSSFLFFFFENNVLMHVIFSIEEIYELL